MSEIFSEGDNKSRLEISRAKNREIGGTAMRTDDLIAWSASILPARFEALEYGLSSLCCANSERSINLSRAS